MILLPPEEKFLPFLEYRSEACAGSYTSSVGNKKEEADAPARRWVGSARSTGIGVCFLYLAESRGAKAVHAEMILGIT